MGEMRMQGLDGLELRGLRLSRDYVGREHRRGLCVAGPMLVSDPADPLLRLKRPGAYWQRTRVAMARRHPRRNQPAVPSVFTSTV